MAEMWTREIGSVGEGEGGSKGGDRGSRDSRRGSRTRTGRCQLASRGRTGRARHIQVRPERDLWDHWIGTLTLEPPSLLCDAVRDDVARELPPLVAYCWKAPPGPGPFDASTPVVIASDR